MLAKGKAGWPDSRALQHPTTSTQCPPGSWLAEQQRFLSCWRVMGWWNTQCLGLSRPYQLWPRSAGRKRVSIPAEPCFRQELFPLSWGRAGPCRAFDTETSEARLWGEQDNRALMLYPKSIASLSPLCKESCLSPSNAAVPAPTLHSRAGGSQKRGCH